MHKRHLFLTRAPALVFILALAPLLIPTAAHAGTIASQDIQGTQSSTFASNSIQQVLVGTSISGTLKSIAIKLSTVSTLEDFRSGNYYLATLDSCNDVDCVSHNDALARFDPYGTSTPHGTLSGGIAVFPVVSGDAESSYTFPGSPAPFYRIRITLRTSDTVYGSASSTALGGGTFKQQNGTVDPNIVDIAVRLCDTYTCDLTPPDTEAPVLGITGTSSTSALPTITGTTTDSADVQLILNSKTYTATPAAGTWSVTLPAGDELADGSYSMTASSTDTASNTGTTTGSLLVDATAPVLSIDTGPADSSTISTSTAEFTFTVTDANLSSTLCAWDGAATSTCSLSASSTLADGAHSFTLFAEDLLGNSASTSRSFTINTAPAPEPEPAVSGGGGGPISGPLSVGYQTPPPAPAPATVIPTPPAGTPEPAPAVAPTPSPSIPDEEPVAQSATPAVEPAPTPAPVQKQEPVAADAEPTELNDSTSPEPANTLGAAVAATGFSIPSPLLAGGIAVFILSGGLVFYLLRRWM